MLKINMEYRKGILFIRLKGELTMFTIKDLINYLIPMIKEKGIKFLVINLSNISLIDNKGKNAIRLIINEARKNMGRGLICSSNIKFEDTIRVVDNELTALNLIKV